MADNSTGIQQTRYLYTPKSVVGPEVKQRIINTLPPQEDVKYSYEISDKFIRVDADGDGFTNDVVGLGIIKRDYATFWKGSNKVQPFYYMIRNTGNGETQAEKGLQVYFSNVDGAFTAGVYRKSFVEDCGSESCRIAEQSGDVHEFDITYVPGRFTAVQGQAVPQLDIFLSYYDQDGNDEKVSEQTRLNLKDFTVGSYAR